MTQGEQKVLPVNNNSNPFNEKLEMCIPARAEWVRVVRLATAGVASRVGFSYEDVEDIKLAVSEACNNAIIHSEHAKGSTPFVKVCWQILAEGVRISVSDEGRLDPPGLPRRTESALPEDSLDVNFSAENSIDDLPESGMGLLLIENLMDEVGHESGPQMDTTIHMTKYVTPVLKDQTVTVSRIDPDAPVALPALKTPPRAGASQLGR